MIKKLSSRKLWVAIAGFAVPLILAFGGSQEAAQQVAALIMSGGTVVAYLVAQGKVDTAEAAESEEE